MSPLLRPLFRPVTYVRWLHLFLPVVVSGLWMFVDRRSVYVPPLMLVPVGLIPWVRLMEGVQAQLMLVPDERGKPDASIAAVESVGWADRARTVLWLEIRLLIGWVTALLSVRIPLLAYDFVVAGTGGTPDGDAVIRVSERNWAYLLLVPPTLLLLPVTVYALGRLITAIARGLLGPSRAQRLAALEERTEQLLERTRIARELHDSIGHALTVAVLQAGAARAAADPAFTDRALAAIEETGRAALEDLERVLLVLRESERPVSQRPTLAEAGRLLESARASGARVEAEVSGPLDQLPGPVSREGYRIVQEALTNALRHSGAVPVRVSIEVTASALGLEITNPLERDAVAPSAGNGLRGIRERAALLGGEARTGPHEGTWRVRARLPLDSR
ncbi:sensor histidine kinase [Streptomyces sp. NPDC088725]|uniref:sensor histidine kinase n=1 Tax=Streptomyces sp. NPDC088725 TaxID=3365873 RepID=UPI00381DD2C7